MIRTVNHNAMPVAGYTTPWSVKPGTNVNVHLSTATPITDVAVQRIDTTNREITNWPITNMESGSCAQVLNQGSYLSIKKSEIQKLDQVSEISFEFFLTRNSGRRTILILNNIHIELENSQLHIAYEDDDFLSDKSLPIDTWLKVSIWEEHGRTKFSILGTDTLSPFELHHSIDNLELNRIQSPIVFGWNSKPDRTKLNAKYSNISIESSKGSINWEFPTLMSQSDLPSTGAVEQVFLSAHNLPTFCVPSLRWNGTSYDPKQVPSHYNAIHCHDDDMSSLDWPVSYQINVPDNAAAGVYAFEAKHTNGHDDVVFFVSSNSVKSPLLFLVPTATYLAYADEFLPEKHFPWQCEDRGHRFAVDNNLRSLYDYHSDLSGVSICSYKKPKATVREDYEYPLCGAPHNLPVDLHLLKFCHNNEIAFDLITDHELHHQGIACLDGHNAVLTGSHPEYMSIEMEESLRQFAAKGGSIGYLGGNGFSGTVAFKDDLMELRRSSLEAGRTWDGFVGEQALAITNEPGGLLRNRGRGEHSLVGGAISLMGFDQAHPFTRTDESYSADCEWLFDGVQKDTFGDQGIVLGGAAGYEVDATDHHLGTSPDTIIIATASGFNENFHQDITRWYEGGIEELFSKRTAEMTIRFLDSGGIIFSASSVAWCGALPSGDEMNDAGRLTLNLLRRLSD